MTALFNYKNLVSSKYFHLKKVLKIYRQKKIRYKKRKTALKVFLIILYLSSF